jgi:hypothetical protein
MSDLESTSMPGLPVIADKANLIISNFLTHYRVNTEGKHPKIPTWVAFPLSLQFINSSFEIFFSTIFLKLSEVYFYNEYGPQPKLYQFNPQLVQEFFEKRQPWEVRDYYIFDLTLGWCIAVTHDDEVFIVGDLR